MIIGHVTTEFINDLQKIVTHFLLIEGFSVGIGDIIAEDSSMKKLIILFKKIKKN